jgi:hypothetical protein
MRSAIGIFGMTAGTVVVALVGRYGFTGSDTALDGMIAAFFFATIAIGGIAGPAVAVHLFRSARGLGRLWGITAGLVAAVAMVANLSNSLGAIAGRADKTTAERIKATDGRRNDQAELARITRERGEMPAFTTATAETVSAAREAVAAAERTRKAECGNGDPSQRGKFCRAREDDEAKAHDALTKAIANKAATDRATALDASAEAVRRRLEAAPAVAKVNPTAETLGRVFSLPAELAATWQQVATVVVVELLIAFALVAWEMLARTPGTPPGPGGAAGANMIPFAAGDPAKFALARLAHSPGRTVAVTDLHEHYAEWCLRHGLRALARSDFEKQFLALASFAGVKRRQVKGRTVCLDLALVA